MRLDAIDTKQSQWQRNGSTSADAATFQTALTQAQAQGGAVDTKDAVKLRQTCKDMEAVFLNMMWSSMRATVPKSSLLGNSNQQEIMQSMLDSEMTKNISQSGGMGLGDMLYRQLAPSVLPSSQEKTAVGAKLTK